MSIYGIKKTIEERKSKKEEEKEVWIKIFISVSSSFNCEKIEVPIKWANEGLEAYLKKFYS